MSNVVPINGDVVLLQELERVALEQERQRFEHHITDGMRRDEASTYMTRSRNGRYVMLTTRAAWIAWQLRGTVDAMDAEKAKNK